MRAGIGMSTATEAAQAGEAATAAALESVGRPDGLLLFAGPGHGEDLSLLVERVIEVSGCEQVVGASAFGVLGGGVEVEDRPAVVALAWAGLDSQPFLMSEVAGDEVSACEELAARFDGGPRAEDLVVLLPDPRQFEPDAFLDAAADVLAPASVVGAGAGDPLSGAPLLWSGHTVSSGGIAGLILRPTKPARIGVTQACRPATGLFEVTRSRGHWILELGGRPALDVYREVARGPLAQDLNRAAHFLLVALPVDPGAEELVPGSYLVRNVIGFDPAANAFAIPEEAPPGRRIALALREPESAREDLKAMLEGVGAEPPALGLYFDCCARGASFFGIPGLEAAYLESHFGRAPIAGMFGSCEIGPVGGRPELLTYTGVLALIDA
jgi:small ligand-binding sensory domain FIST